jgi:hypothetical protein
MMQVVFDVRLERNCRIDWSFTERVCVREAENAGQQPSQHSADQQGANHISGWRV